MKIGLLLLLLCGSVFAGETGTRYDAGGHYIGTYRVTEDGTIRLYDSNGNYAGKVVTREHGATKYDDKGKYAGRYSSEDEEDGEE